MKKSPQFKTIETSLLDLPVTNEFTHTPTAIKELADNIKANGLLNPLTVTPTDNGRYEIVAGERRFRAITGYLQWDKVPCTVFTKQNAVEKGKKRISENHYRDTYNWVTKAKEAWNLYCDGVSMDDLAELLGTAIDTPKRLVRVGRYLSGCNDAPRNLGDLPKGYATAAAIVGVFTEQHGQKSDLPAEAIPTITNLFTSALNEGWSAERLLAEAKAKGPHKATYRVEREQRDPVTVHYEAHTQKEREGKLKSLDYREAMLKGREQAFAQNIGKFPKEIIRAATTLNKALRVACSSSIMDGFIPEDENEVERALEKVINEIQDFMTLKKKGVR